MFLSLNHSSGKSDSKLGKQDSKLRNRFQNWGKSGLFGHIVTPKSFGQALIFGGKIFNDFVRKVLQILFSM